MNQHAVVKNYFTTGGIERRDMKILTYDVVVEVPDSAVDQDVYRAIRDAVFMLGYKTTEVSPAENGYIIPTVTYKDEWLELCANAKGRCEIAAQLRAMDKLIDATEQREENDDTRPARNSKTSG